MAAGAQTDRILDLVRCLPHSHNRTLSSQRKGSEDPSF